MKKLEGFYAGINLGGWFSQCDYSQETYDHFIEKEDLAVIKSWGFDHVRVPVDYNLFQNRDGSYIEAGFERIDRVIEWCREYGLHMVLDLHKTLGFSFDAGEKEEGLFGDERYQQIFCDLWEKLAKRYGHNSDMLAFELLNEVTEPEFMPKWNALASKTIGIIRQHAGDIKILVGGYYNNSAEAVPAIDVPIDDNIVFNFHCYEPLLFTHQGAYWIPGMDTSYRFAYKSSMSEYKAGMEAQMDRVPPMLNPRGTDEAPDAEYFKACFEAAIKAAEEKGVALYCGEYGVIELAGIEDTKEWFEDIHEAFRAYGIGHALWSYRKMDFDFVGDRMDPVRDTIIATSIAK